MDGRPRHGGEDMSTALSAADYEHLAQEYLARLPAEHFMEGTPHARQREITVESFAVYRTRRPDLQYFNELLVQRERTSYVSEHEPVPLFLVMEYVSASNKRKDYVDNFHKYERELKVL